MMRVLGEGWKATQSYFTPQVDPYMIQPLCHALVKDINTADILQLLSTKFEMIHSPAKGTNR